MSAASPLTGRDLLASLFPPGVVAVSTRETGDLDDLDDLDDLERAIVRHAGNKRQREFAAGRHCARTALAQLGIRGFAVLSDAQRAPIWPDGIVGSITHCRGYCAAAVAPDGVAHSLGIDVEVSEALAAPIVERICTPDERRRLSELPTLSGVDWGKLTFSAKESVYKCYFPLARTVLGFRDVELDIAPDAGRFSARLIRENAPSAAGARHFDGYFGIGESHVLTAVTLQAAADSTADPDDGARDPTSASQAPSKTPSTRPQGGSS
jgi:4'-phosphopantetheinyl transferase EntD